MAGLLHGCGARLLRLLGVLLVVAGVFGMHGLTSHHDAAMAVPGAPMVMPMEHTRPSVVQIVPADEMDGMGGACMAVLTGLALVLALLLGLRSLLVWRVIGAPVRRLPRVLGERSPPSGRMLSSLGVLRI
ncbi:DUF6153 family protein [Kribbella solani]|uniref:Uncharacterized protein n=1 Tax=Kribbella solani TaxID=236067 RepID=A0A841DZ61_9ACTN|nr:DUF6153 family protein [Kribbella solani]MBB5983853.1 hypothetical protein [Kribbella solani]